MTQSEVRVAALLWRLHGGSFVLVLADGRVMVAGG